MSDLISFGVFEHHPSLTLAIVEFELVWTPHLLSAMDSTYRVPPRRQAISDRTAAFTHATMIEYDDPRRAIYR